MTKPALQSVIFSCLFLTVAAFFILPLSSPMHAEEKSQGKVPKEFVGLRYVGCLGSKGVVEIPKENSSESQQKILAVGEMFGGCKVFAVHPKSIEFRDEKGKGYVFDLRGLCEEGEADEELESGYFSIRGSIINNGQKPSWEDRVTFYDENGEVAAAAMVDPDLKYKTFSAKTLKRAEYMNPKTGCVIRKEGIWDKDATIDFDLAKEKTFTLTLKIKGEGLEDSQSLEFLFFDEQGGVLARQTADLGRDTLFKSNAGISRILLRSRSELVLRVELMGPGRHAREKKRGAGADAWALERLGLWSENAIIEFDLRDEKQKTKNGKILLEGRPLTEPVQIKAYDDKGFLLSSFFTDKQGEFNIRSGMKISKLTVFAAGAHFLLDELWKDNDALEVDLSKFKIKTYKGKIRDKNGGQVPFAKLVWVTSQGWKLADNSNEALDLDWGWDYENAGSFVSSFSGRFSLRTNAEISSLIIQQPGETTLVKGPWEDRKNMDIQLDTTVKRRGE